MWQYIQSVLIFLKESRRKETNTVFKVRAKIQSFLGDENKYPCHFGYKIGEEIIYDGEKFIGRICPDILTALAPKVFAMFAAGPRYIEPAYYYPFWYAPPSIRDESKKISDGLGFKNVLQTHKESQYHMANLITPKAFNWPPYKKRTVFRSNAFICPDTRTATLVKLEAFDLSDKGSATPWFRRQMVILGKVLQKPGIVLNKIINEFSEKETYEIYPALSPILLQTLVEELELMGYVEIQNKSVRPTGKGKTKFQEFKAGLTGEERKALKI